MRTFRTAVLTLGLAWCLNAQFPDFTQPTPLLGALLYNDTAKVKQLLAGGANPNEGNFFGFSPIFLTVIHNDQELLRAFVAKGADVKARDGSGATTLMWAAFNEKGDTTLVEELLRLGVDPNATNKAGESALTWARRRGFTPVIAVLQKAGASDTATIRQSATKALALLQTSGTEFVKVSGCVSCHHQSLPQMALSMARPRGLAVNEEAAHKQVLSVIALMRPIREVMLQKKQMVPDPAVTVSYLLVGLGAEGYPADETTDAMAKLISIWQFEDGSFPALPMRPPIESSRITATALSLRALQLYGKDSSDQVARATKWLRTAKPSTNEERAMRLLGMTWGSAPANESRDAARELIAMQRPDGGWAQLDTLETDAYATGQALTALNLSGHVESSNATYQRGIAFLTRTQFPDGSWLVRTRTFPIQPYKESGFPHGKDQWISASGTSWAAMALSLALPSQQLEAAR